MLYKEKQTCPKNKMKTEKRFKKISFQMKKKTKQTTKWFSLQLPLHSKTRDADDRKDLPQLCRNIKSNEPQVTLASPESAQKPKKIKLEDKIENQAPRGVNEEIRKSLHIFQSWDICLRLWYQKKSHAKHTNTKLFELCDAKVYTITSHKDAEKWKIKERKIYIWNQQIEQIMGLLFLKCNGFSYCATAGN